MTGCLRIGFFLDWGYSFSSYLWTLRERQNLAMILLIKLQVWGTVALPVRFYKVHWVFRFNFSCKFFLFLNRLFFPLSFFTTIRDFRICDSPRKYASTFLSHRFCRSRSLFVRIYFFSFFFLDLRNLKVFFLFFFLMSFSFVSFSLSLSTHNNQRIELVHFIWFKILSTIVVITFDIFFKIDFIWCYFHFFDDI